MKLLKSVCGVIAALGIVCMAAGQEEGKSANKDMESLQGAWQVKVSMREA